MKYKYSIVSPPRPDGRFIKRPILKVTLCFANEAVAGLGLVDSGADKTLCNIGYARLLGLDLSKCSTENFRGIGGESIPCRVLEVEVGVEHISGRRRIPVGFIDSQSVDILLGQEGFFDEFRIKFEKDHDTFEVVPTTL